MLTREQVIEAVEAATAMQQADGISVRDVMIRDRQISLTVLGADAAAQPALEASLREALARLGAETVHFRFRDEAAPAAGAGASAPPPAAAKAAAAQRPAAGKPSGSAPVQGHGAGLASPLLDPRSGVKFIAV